MGGGGLRRGEGREEVAQTMHTHENKYKNDKRRKKK
jgi:hypothetical protein